MSRGGPELEDEAAQGGTEAMTVGGRLGEFVVLEIEEASLRLAPSALGWSSGTQSKPVRQYQPVHQPTSQSDRQTISGALPGLVRYVFLQSVSLYSSSVD